MFLLLIKTSSGASIYLSFLPISTPSTIERPKVTTFFFILAASSIIALILVKLEANAVIMVFFWASSIYLPISFKISLSDGEWLGRIALVESENKTSRPSLPIFSSFEKSVKLPIGW